MPVGITLCLTNFSIFQAFQAFRAFQAFQVFEAFQADHKKMAIIGQNRFLCIFTILTEPTVIALQL